MPRIDPVRRTVATRALNRRLRQDPDDGLEAKQIVAAYRRELYGYDSIGKRILCGVRKPTLNVGG